jgi:hypothetical protein
MPRTCLACRHPDREAIDRDLLAGVPKRSIAARYGLSEGSAQRHRAHIAAPVLATWSASQAEIYAGLADYTAELERDARRIAEQAREQGNARLELQAIAASRAHVELMAKLVAAAQNLEPEERLRREREQGATQLAEAALRAIEELVELGDLHPQVAQALRERVADRLTGAGARPTR